MKALLQEDEEHGPRMAPLIDVVFLLLIFFLVATTFYEAEKDITIRLAQSGAGADRDKTTRLIVVNVRASGVIVVNDRIQDPATLRDTLATAHTANPGVVVIVRCDRHAHYKHFVDVLTLCEETGIRNVSVAVFGTDEEAPST